MKTYGERYDELTKGLPADQQELLFGAVEQLARQLVKSNTAANVTAPKQMKTGNPLVDDARPVDFKVSAGDPHPLGDNAPGVKRIL